jgi:2'-5' RNA ligase
VNTGSVAGCHDSEAEADAQIRALYASEEEVIQAAAGPDTSVLAMVAVYPRGEEANALAVEGGIEADDLHVTLVFLGEADDINEEAVTDAVAAAAAAVGPLEGNVGGVGNFAEGEDGVPVILLPDVQGLTLLRERVMAELERRGSESPSEHGFLPHMTLRYAETDELPDHSAVGNALHFDAVSVVVADRRTDYPLGSALIAAANTVARELAAAMARGMVVSDAVAHVNELYSPAPEPPPMRALDALTLRVETESIPHQATVALVQSLEAITERVSRSERESTELTAVLALLVDRINSRPDGQESLEALALAIADRLQPQTMADLPAPIVNVTVPEPVVNVTVPVTVPPSEPVVNVTAAEQEPPIVNVHIEPPATRRIEFDRDARGRIVSAEEVA